MLANFPLPNPSIPPTRLDVYLFLLEVNANSSGWFINQMRVAWTAACAGSFSTVLDRHVDNFLLRFRLPDHALRAPEVSWPLTTAQSTASVINTCRFHRPGWVGKMRLANLAQLLPRRTFLASDFGGRFHFKFNIDAANDSKR